MHEVKILLLFILSRLGDPIRLDEIAAIAQTVSKATFFEISSALASLCETGSASESSGDYSITEKGEGFGQDLYSFLTYSQKLRLERAVFAFTESRDKKRVVITDREAARRGGVIVGMSIKDGGDEIISLRLLTPDDRTAQRIEARFTQNVAEMYNAIISAVFDENSENNEKN